MAGPNTKNEEEELQLPNELAEDFETLPFSWSFVTICIMMPFLNGQMNGLLFSAYTLHYEEMGWPVVRAGLAVSIGFVARIVAQETLLRVGYWLAVPLGIVHVTFATFPIFYKTSEWAVFGEIVVTFAFHAALAIEGITFDTFGDSEAKAKQAASMTLSVFTMSMALSCTIGGIMYDFLGWTGVAAYHAGAEGLLVILLCLQPSCRKSFMEFFLQPAAAPDLQPGNEGVQGDQQLQFLRVVPADPATRETTVLPGVIEEIQVEDLTNSDQLADSEIENCKNFASPPSDEAHERREAQAEGREASGISKVIPDRRSQASNRQSQASNRQSQVSNRRSQASNFSQNTQNTHRTTTRSKMSNMSNISQISKVSESAQLFSYTFGASTLPQYIAGAAGEKKVPRYDLDAFEDQGEIAQKTESSRFKSSIPKDVRFPAALVVMNAFYNNFAYPMEYATFALYFRQIHHWNEATWASLAQTAGDVVASILIQVLSRFAKKESEAEVGYFRHILNHITSSPYNVSFLLVTWVIFNLGMMSPWLAVAIVSQILMGTSYVYSMKWTSDMNLFYSLGDSQVFLNLQVMTKNAEAMGGVFAGILGQLLYIVDPTAPFFFAAAVGFAVFLLYTVGFYARLGFVDDIETAEAKRARRNGIVRVSSWRSDTTAGSIRRSTLMMEEDGPIIFG